MATNFKEKQISIFFFIFIYIFTSPIPIFSSPYLFFDSKPETRIIRVLVLSANRLKSLKIDGVDKINETTIPYNCINLSIEGGRLVNKEGIVSSESFKVSTRNIFTVTIPDIPQIKRFYRGKLQITFDSSRREIQVINLIPLNDYLAGVLAGEMGNKFASAALQAQAVISRTWTLSHLRPKKVYDFSDCTKHQVYFGVSRNWRNYLEAVSSTMGLILAYSGSPIDAVFHSTCGGELNSARQIWGNDIPYLTAKKDISDEEVVNCKDSPFMNWDFAIKVEMFHKLLREAFNTSGEITGIRIRERKRQLYVQLLGVGKFLPLDTFRLSVNKRLGEVKIRSNNFTIEKDGEFYVIKGHGYGHNVGLCQYGANYMAKQGKDFKDILSFYYPYTRLIQWGKE
ncbi:MAG: SpoIID/LytB domain-containing protein [bacterium]